jgi:ABC-type branched-subunit amino acid transport system ATPase component
MKLFGANLNTSRWLFVVAVVCLFLVLVVLRNLYRHAPGNMWRAIREDPMASGVIGINVEKWRLLAFVGSSAVTALAGSLFAYLIGLVAFSTFTLTLGISLVVMVYLGGIGSPVGVFIGAAAITFLPNGLQDLANLAPAGSSFSSWLISNQGTDESLVYGTVLIVILLFEPAGLAGIGRNVAGRVVRRVRRIRRAPAEELSNVVKEDSADATPVSGAVAPEVAIVTDQEVLSQRATNAILKMTDVTVTYRNGAQGIHEVNLVIEPSTIVAIVGRNGAGKSSTLQAIAGFLPAERVRVRGSVKWKGQEIIRSSPRKTGRAGVILVPERFKVFPSLTVQEHFKADGISSQREKECLEQFTVLQGFLKTKGGLLSGGERQLLGIVLAVARRPELLMVDELSLGLSPIATQSMLAELKRVRDEEGIAILLVDQAASAISHVVDYYYLLDGGSVVGEGSAEHVTEQQIRAAVMGE